MYNPLYVCRGKQYMGWKMIREKHKELKDRDLQPPSYYRNRRSSNRASDTKTDSYSNTRYRDGKDTRGSSREKDRERDRDRDRDRPRDRERGGERSARDGSRERAHRRDSRDRDRRRDGGDRDRDRGRRSRSRSHDKRSAPLTTTNNGSRKPASSDYIYSRNEPMVDIKRSFHPATTALLSTVSSSIVSRGRVDEGPEEGEC